MGMLHESKLDANLHETSEAYLEPLQISNILPLTVFAKSSILDVCGGSKYTSGYNYL